MQPNVYVTPHQHSQIIGKAFAQGCNGTLEDTGWTGGRLYEFFQYDPIKSGPVALYGILRGCGGILKQCEALGRDYFYIDHGYFRRGHYEGYYRVTKNALQHDGSGDYPRDRFKKLNMKIRDWKQGRNIVVCPISSPVGGFLNVNPETWLKAVLNELRKHTDRPIVVKQKDQTPVSAYFKDAWAVVTHSSNAAVDALIGGVPAFVLGRSGANGVALSDLRLIENPVYPDREQWAANLAYSQFTLEEFRNGTAWGVLNDL